MWEQWISEFTIDSSEWNTRKEGINVNGEYKKNGRIIN